MHQSMGKVYRAEFPCNGRETRGVNTCMNVKTPVPNQEPTRDRDRLITRFREHRLKSVLMAAGGLWISDLVVGEMTESAARWVLPPLAVAAILVGGTLSALLVYLTGAPSIIGRRNADFWEAGGFVRHVVEAAFSLCAALAWSFLLLFLFGTRGAR